MDESKVKTETVGNSGSTLRAASIGTYDYRILVVRNTTLNVAREQRPGVQVVHGNVEEPLILRVVEIQRNNTIKQTIVSEHQ